FFTDSRNITKWQPSIQETKATVEGPAQVGTRVTEVRSFLGRKMESTYEITEVEPNRKMGLKSISGPFPYTGSINFEPEGDATTVTFNAEMEPTGFFKLAEGMLAGGMKKQLKDDLEQAK